MPDEEKAWNIDLKQSTEDLIIERYGRKVGKRIVKCIKDCLKVEKDKDKISDCITKCVRQEIGMDEISDERLGNLLDIMGHYETIG